MAQGVDVTEFDLFPPDITAPTGFLRPIFDFTCGRARNWNGEYAVPDQVESVINLPAGSLSIQTRVNENMQQLKKSLAARVGLDLDAGMFGSFSASGGYKDAKEKMLKTEKSVSEVRLFWGFYLVFWIELGSVL